MSVSQHAGDFILERGMLMAALHARRPTVDIDLLANDEQSVLDRVTAIVARSVEPDDGVGYLPETARARTIRDPVTPEAGWIDYPSVLPSGSSVRLRGYPWTPCSPRTRHSRDPGRGQHQSPGLRRPVDPDRHPRPRRRPGPPGDHRHRPPPRSRTDHPDRSHHRADRGAGRRVDAYRQALGNEGDHLPTSYATVVGDIRTFADPVLQQPSHQTRRWSAAARR